MIERFIYTYVKIKYKGRNMTQNVSQKSKPKVKRFVFYATPEFVEEIEKIGAKYGINNRSELIRMALREFVERRANKNG
ncbi:hypothetical protein SJAV_13300 [Sulfurisphaera javensis]|uniref:Ribbon-helix-helix protein CopG domain-containing protein n=2 Tax=Sulfurisphaera javensis TaxID=2049879 RepID=A0AAT9GRX5_9CREN